MSRTFTTTLKLTTPTWMLSSHEPSVAAECLHADMTEAKRRMLERSESVNNDHLR